MSSPPGSFLSAKISFGRGTIPLFFCTCFVIIFSWSLQGGFVYDDVRVIQDNLFIRDPANILKFFSPLYFSGSEEMSYRPLVTLSYMLDFALFGLQPFVYRLHNLLLHGTTCLLLWGVLCNITRSRAAAWWATFLYCFHPIQVETVAVAGLREEMQCAIFILLGWLCLWHGGRWILASLAYALALLSKETALFFPPVVVAALILERRRIDAHHLPLNREHSRRLYALASLGVVTILYGALRFFWLKTEMEDSFSYLGGTVWRSVLTHWTAWTRGILCLVFPQNLLVDPWLPTQYSPWNIVILSCTVVWLFLLAAVAWALIFNRIVAFGFAWFFLALIPVSGLIPIVNVYADRYFYLPLLGGAIAFAAWLSKLRAVWYRRLVPLGAAWIGLLMLLAYQRVGVFHDNQTMWTDALNKLGKKPWPLGLLSFQADTPKEPLAFLQELTAKEPYAAATWARLAAAYYIREDYENAARAFQISLDIHPNNSEVQMMMGDAYCQMGRPADAQTHYEKALALKPDFAEAHNNLGVLFLNQKNYEQAGEEFQKAIALKPNFADAMCNLASVLANQREYEDAVRWWKEALRVNKYHAAARWNLSGVLGREPFRSSRRPTPAPPKE